MRITSGTALEKNGQMRILAFDKHMRKLELDPGFKPYFYIKSSEHNQAEKALEEADLPFDFSLDKTDNLIFGKKELCSIIEVNLQRNIYDYEERPSIRKALEAINVECYEGDIPLMRRWMINKDVYPQEEFDTLFWDMEVDGRAGFPEPINPFQRILSLSAVTSDGREETFCYDSEETTVREFLEVAKNYPVWCGYNSNKWDLPYFRNRLRNIEIRYPLSYHQHIDMMTMYDKSDFGSYSSLKLDDVAHRELGAGKTFDIGALGGAKALWDMFKGNRGELEHYNLIDTRLLKQLNDKLHLIEMRTNQAMLSGILISDTEFVSRIVDTRLMRRLFKLSPKKILRSRRYGMKAGEKYPGALVLESDRSIVSWVVSFDFKSLYPSIVIVWNMGIDTISDDGDILSANAKFISSPDSEIVAELKLLKTLRNQYKINMNQFKENTPDWLKWHLMQSSVKLIMNSAYGALGEENSRLYDKEVVSSITLTGQDIMKIAIRYAALFGLKTLHGHSVIGNTSIPLVTSKGFLKNSSIEELFNHYSRDSIAEEEREIIDLKNRQLYTFAINSDEKVKVRRILSVIRHKNNEKLYEVETVGGKKVRVTEGHSLMIKGMIPVKPKDLYTDALLYTFDVNYSDLPNMQKRTKISDYISFKNSWNNICSASKEDGNKTHKSFFNLGERKNALEQRYDKIYRYSSSQNRKNKFSEIIERSFLECWNDERKINREDGSRKVFSMAEAKRCCSERILSTESSKIRRECSEMDNIWEEAKKQSYREFIYGFAEIAEDRLQISKSDSWNLPRFSSTLQMQINGDMDRWMLLARMLRAHEEFVIMGTDEYKERQEARSNLSNSQHTLFENLGTRHKERLSECADDDTSFSREERVKSVTEINDKVEYVYDLEVEECHTFLANNIFVHNTDGLLMSLPVKNGEEALKFYPKIEKKINDILKRELMTKYHIPTHRYFEADGSYGILFEFSSLYRKIFFPGTKTGYVGWEYSREKTTFKESMTVDGYQGAMSIVGMSVKKYNTSKFLRQLQYDVLAILEKADNISDVTDQVRDLCLSKNKDLYNGKLDETLVMRTGIHKKMDNYDTNTIQLRLAKQLNKLGIFREGDIIDYVIATQEKNLDVQAIIPGSNTRPVITQSGYEYYENAMLDTIESMTGVKPDLHHKKLEEYWKWD